MYVFQQGNYMSVWWYDMFKFPSSELDQHKSTIDMANELGKNIGEMYRIITRNGDNEEVIYPEESGEYDDYRFGFTHWAFHRSYDREEVPHRVREIHSIRRSPREIPMQIGRALLRPFLNRTR